MQTSGNIVVNGVTYTIGNTYSFKGSVSGKASSDGTGATAMSLNDLKSNYSDYSAYYPKMKLGASAGRMRIICLKKQQTIEFFNFNDNI